jgi:hypothetical protein
MLGEFVNKKAICCQDRINILLLGEKDSGNNSSFHT